MTTKTGRKTAGTMTKAQYEAALKKAGILGAVETTYCFATKRYTVRVYSEDIPGLVGNDRFYTTYTYTRERALELAIEKACQAISDSY